MPLIFITLNYSFIAKIKNHGFRAEMMRIKDYVPVPNRKTYYISPANSTGNMGAGVDYDLSRIIFPNIEKTVVNIINELKCKNKDGENHLPIGSSAIIDIDMYRSLVISPTMLIPEDVSKTQNAYYATISTLYNILVNKGENINDVDILMPAFCCGFGRMDETVSISQILQGINDFKNYKPNVINNNIITSI
jgi:O-acetyl-ADP-ribose deacetylase (regulator of RNase III)